MDNVAETKVCRKCGIRRPVTDFYVKYKATGRRHARCKDCHNAITLAHYHAGGEGMKKKRAEQARQSYAADPERHRAACKRNRAKDPERTRALYRQQDERRKEKRAAYRAANKGRRDAYNSAWKKANKDKVCLYNHQRWSRGKDVVNDLTADQWQEIIAAQGGRCLHCGRSFTADLPATRDHIVPLSKGGGLTRSNVAALCRPCNSRKRDRVRGS